MEGKRVIFERGPFRLVYLWGSYFFWIGRRLCISWDPQDTIPAMVEDKKTYGR